MKTYDDIAEWYNQWISTHGMSDDPYFPACVGLPGRAPSARAF